ncbi:hypothetical protein [Laribacter hongkongensis]|uniref:hypothetical protein n=1 Tax=Laribacter hongkongensis TaxID=168471 RepID=UPI001EFE4374|nr:hypothetical protein [Laribacter hongkongensis]MCG9096420.1 hypothetical protein [Laribacter hongkongensis]
MAHPVEAMAYTGTVRRHGLGNSLTGRQPVGVWQREAGMDWSIAHSDVLFNVADDGMLMCGAGTVPLRYLGQSGPVFQEASFKDEEFSCCDRSVFCKYPVSHGVKY